MTAQDLSSHRATAEGLSSVILDGVMHLVLDSPGEKVNTLKPELVESLLEMLEHSRSDPSIEGVLIRSGKAGHFMAGVDINLFGRIGSEAEFEALARRGQQVLDLIEHFPKPIVACIWGSCMGGGTELALACRYRVVAKDPETRIALPEVKIGLLPGMGGTQRLPRRIGFAKALPYLLTGKNMYAYQALQTGFADELVQAEYLVPAAIGLIRRGPGREASKRLARIRRRSALERMWPVRTLLAAMAGRQAAASTHGHYPAPQAIIDSAVHGLRHGMEMGLRYEARRFAELASTSVSKSLIHLFFAMNEAKKNPFRPGGVEVGGADGGSPGSDAGGVDGGVVAGPAAKGVRIGLVGTGLMGQGIAEVSADHDMQVTLHDLDPKTVSRAVKAIHASLQKKMRSRQIDRLTAERRMSGIRRAASREELDGCGMVIEAVVEQLEVKQALFEDLEKVAGADAILASNTSSLPISSIAERCAHPERVVGMHYFSPVQKMPLLEIIRTGKTSRSTLERCYDIGLMQGKVPIVVRDGPGFYTSRILAPYMNEAMLMFEEGTDVATVDRIMRGAGFPVGPFALLDEVGLDVAAHVGSVLSEHFAGRGAKVSMLSGRLCEAGITGRKSGSGFYLYGSEAGRWRRRSGRPRNPATERYRAEGAGRRREGLAQDSLAQENLAQEALVHYGPAQESLVRDRLMLMMVNEAVLCLQDGTLSTPRDGDLGAILGLGFPPFLGGPFRWIDAVGAQEVCASLDRLRGIFGQGFEAAPLLREKVREGSMFHS